ncbi:Segregation and condensation protein B [Zhongshania aliphaticivorans]|uniref:Segregation and condensation protein B n=1 Tax=Zhongshania aliphaticivorans TaxID=1470434 RepID=A0A5S9NH73_9GAMM|nr:SMC-Scp complex subunit ScpB [Zhongshania aliphaticivorans]CAA0089858.1 Segregation and condensation protein B [Zhongshania aliphaticivorans]CAA0096933.1 Segregation and condensation protein B [Zhongshania aliphaticivorans]
MIPDIQQLKRIVEAALMAVGRPLTLQHIAELFDPEERPTTGDIQDALNAIKQDCDGRGFELKVVASGYRLQVCDDLAPWVGRLWEEKPQRYSRAMLETLALIAYRQPITRGDIEDIRGVAVSSQIIKTMLEREWVRVVGHKDVPGRPAMYATTRKFLDYFNLRNLDELPSLAEITDLDTLNGELELNTGEFAEDTSSSDNDIAETETETETESGSEQEVNTDSSSERIDDQVYDQDYPPETNF